MSTTKNPLFAGSLTHPATQYVGLPINGRALGCTVGWLDATSSATITVELTDTPFEEAAVTDAGSAWEWIDSGETITGPAASAAGGTLIQIENVNHSRARLKIVTAADCDFLIYGFESDGR